MSASTKAATQTVITWAVANQDKLIQEAKRRETTPSQLIVEMLDDALDAYSQVEVFK